MNGGGQSLLAAEIPTKQYFERLGVLAGAAWMTMAGETRGGKPIPRPLLPFSMGFSLVVLSKSPCH